MTARAPRPRPVLSNVTSWSNVQLLRLGLRPRSQGWLSVVGVPTGLLLTPVRVDLGVSGSSVRYLLASNMDWDWVASARNADLAVLTYRDVDRRVGVTSRRVVLADITGELTSFTDSVLRPLAKSAATVAEPGTSHIVLHVSDTAENDSVSYTHLRAHETDSYLVC